MRIVFKQIAAAGMVVGIAFSYAQYGKNKHTAAPEGSKGIGSLSPQSSQQLPSGEGKSSQSERESDTVWDALTPDLNEADPSMGQCSSGDSVPESSPQDEQSLYRALLNAFMSLKPGEPIHLPFNPADIAHCYSCVQLIQNQFLSGALTSDQLHQLAEWLTGESYTELTAMVADTVRILLSRDGVVDRSASLIPLLAHLDSADAAGQLINYLLANGRVPYDLEYAMLQNINDTTDRQQVAAVICDRFMTTADPSERERLLSIGQPDALVRIALMAAEQGNEGLYSKASEYLSSSPSQFTFEAFLSMAQAQAHNARRQADIIASAQQWAYSQLSGSRLDTVDEYLEGAALSEQDKKVARSILEHSEDQARGKEIIAKYWRSH